MLLAQENVQLHLHFKQPASDLKKTGVGIAQVQLFVGAEEISDTQTSMPSGIPKGAICVQRFDDSLNSAIHITYRISLRSSSMREPRDPLLKVVFEFFDYSESLDLQLKTCERKIKSNPSWKGLLYIAHKVGMDLKVP